MSPLSRPEKPDNEKTLKDWIDYYQDKLNEFGSIYQNHAHQTWLMQIRDKLSEMRNSFLKAGLDPEQFQTRFINCTPEEVLFPRACSLCGLPKTHPVHSTQISPSSPHSFS